MRSKGARPALLLGYLVLVLVSRLLQPCKANAGGAVTKKELCCNDQIRKDRGRENRTEGAMSERERQGQPPFFSLGPYVFGTEYLVYHEAGTKYEARKLKVFGRKVLTGRQVAPKLRSKDQTDRLARKEGETMSTSWLLPLRLCWCTSLVARCSPVVTSPARARHCCFATS